MTAPRERAYSRRVMLAGLAGLAGAAGLGGTLAYPHVEAARLWYDVIGVAMFNAVYLRGHFARETFWTRSIFLPPFFRTGQWLSGSTTIAADAPASRVRWTSTPSAGRGARSPLSPRVAPAPDCHASGVARGRHLDRLAAERWTFPLLRATERIGRATRGVTAGEEWTTMSNPWG